MDWQKIALDNAPALIALCGVALGALLAGTISIIAQSQFRKWNVIDQRREWRRVRLREKLTIVINWQEQWLRLATRVRSAEGSPEEAQRFSRKHRDPALSQLAQDLQDQGYILSDLSAITRPIISAIGDQSLATLCDRFRELASSYSDVLAADDPTEAIESNIKVVSTISEVMARTLEQAEQLLQDTFEGSI